MLSHGHESEISSHHGPVASHSFSRARQVALVCILAGASFLNVRYTRKAVCGLWPALTELPDHCSAV